MSNIAIALKAEISRLARKQVKSETEGLKRAISAYRHEIAALKKRIASLERQRKKGASAVAFHESPQNGPTALRFSATRLATQRRKLGLSAADFALLLGVSSLSVYKWERGQTRPRTAQLEAIAAARGLGKREAQIRLEILKVAK